jgi:hypothetical protein
MKKIKVSEATLNQLNWLAAKCSSVFEAGGNPHNEPLYLFQIGYSPSTDWSQGGPIIEREKIVLYIYTTSGGGSSYRGWSANKHERQYDEESGEYIKGSDFFMIGDTPLIAAMRCYVASKLGNEVDIPEELL